MSEAPTIHIVDDEEDVAALLQLIFAKAGYAAQTYGSADALLRACPGLAPGCVVTDVRMPGMDGLELVRQLRNAGLPHPIVILTGHADVPLAVAGLKAGAFHFLEKPFDNKAVLATVAAALAAQRGGQEAMVMQQEFVTQVSRMTPREREVLRGVVVGKSNKVIARDLGISPRTVEAYRNNVMAKSGAQSLAALVRMSFSAGL